jgi:hypothetical protein
METFEYTETWGAVIRQFLRELFGSRYLEHLEAEILRLRNDHDRALHEKDLVIAELRTEKAQLNGKIITYENTIMNHSSKMGAEIIASQKPKPPSPKFSFADLPPTKSRWQQYQDQYYKEQEEAEKREKVEAATAANKE